MYWKFIALLLLSFLAIGESKATEHVDTESSMTNYPALVGVLAIVGLVVLVALCAGEMGGAVREVTQAAPSLSTGGGATGKPAPNWTKTIVPEPALDTGFTGTSDGINIINNNCVHRHRKGGFETDGARWGGALSKGKHVFEIYWPTKQRGPLATVGVGTEDAPLFVKPKDSLVGCNKTSWGLDITRKRLFHKGEMLGTMPTKGVVPDKFYMLVDCDGGTLGFASDNAYWGAPINIPRANFPVYAMIGSMCENSQITMIYRGSENKNNAPGNINVVTVPSTEPNGQVQVTVVNPGDMKGAGASGYGPPEAPPAYTPNDPAPSYQADEKAGPPADAVEAEKEPPQDDDKAETHIAPIQVSGV